jgi:hypothetical protein
MQQIKAYLHLRVKILSGLVRSVTLPRTPTPASSSSSTRSPDHDKQQNSLAQSTANQPSRLATSSGYGSRSCHTRSKSGRSRQNSEVDNNFNLHWAFCCFEKRCRAQVDNSRGDEDDELVSRKFKIWTMQMKLRKRALRVPSATGDHKPFFTLE